MMPTPPWSTKLTKTFAWQRGGMGAVLAGGGDGGVRWWCRLWLWYLRLARRFEHLGLLVGVGRVGVVEARGVAGEHLDKRLGRHLLARVIDLAALVNVHAGHTLGGGLVEELAGEGVLRRVGDVVDGKGGLIGWGVFNPFSMYRVRLLATEEASIKYPQKRKKTNERKSKR